MSHSVTHVRDTRKKPKLGHLHCSVHRECAGSSHWEPDNCTYCLESKEQYASMSTEERNGFFQELREMLKRMHQNFKAQGIDWEYRMIVSSFLETELTPTSTPSSESSNLGEITPAPTDEHSHINNVSEPSDINIENILANFDREQLLSIVNASLKKTGGGTPNRRC